MERQIFWDNGHHLGDPGARHKSYSENEMTIELGNKLLYALRDDFGTIRMVPDNLNLASSIDFVNQSARPDDFAVSVHFNAHSDTSVSGTEVYYSDLEEKRIAEVFARHISKALFIPNRGARPDRWTWVGSLGWLRKLKCNSILVETCYLTSDSDMGKYTPERALVGFYEALSEIYPPTASKPVLRQSGLSEIQLHALKEFIYQFLKDKVSPEKVKEVLDLIKGK